MLTIGVGNAWADYTVTFKTLATEESSASSYSKSNDIGSGGNYVSSVSGANTVRRGTSSDGMLFGSSNKAGELTITLTSSGTYIGQIQASKITFNGAKKKASNGGNLQYVITYTDDETKSGSITLSTDADNYDVNLTSTKTIKTVKISASGSKKMFYVKGFTVVAAAAVTSVTASPASISFDDNTVEVGTDEATSTITLSNGYPSYGNYLYGWFEDLSDEDHCEFFVNDGSTYSYSTSGSATPTLTFSYLADAAGTFTGKFIIQGYNSSYTAVNCTIPLSVTLTSSCSSAVSIATGSQTNCTLSASAASVSTCSGTRQVTISVTPSSCYAAPVKASVTSTGTTATWVSGPTLNAGHYDYVYSFAENATGTATFNASLSTKISYTVQYNAGATTCTGGNAITGSHDNDTKICGTNLTLPGETFHTTGYTQTGWTKTPCGSQTNGLGGTYSSNAAQTFYPVWTPNNYTVTWKVNNENYSAGGSSSVTHGNHITTLPSAPNLPTYGCGDVFVGWTDVQNYVHGTSPLYTTAAEFPNATGDQVFYAVYADYTTE